MKTAIALLLCATALAAHAQTVYKCTMDGKVAYGEHPCPADAASATTLNVPAAPAPPAQADAEAARDLKRQKKEAAALEKSRHQREDKDARELDKAAQVAAVRNKKCAKLALTKKWADDDVRAAGFKTIDSAKVKAKRAADTLALECPK